MVVCMCVVFTDLGFQLTDGARRLCLEGVSRKPYVVQSQNEHWGRGWRKSLREKNRCSLHMVGQGEGGSGEKKPSGRKEHRQSECRQEKKKDARTGALATEKWPSYQARETLEIFTGARKRGWVCTGTQTDPRLRSFDFAVMRKWYAFSRSHNSDVEFWSLPMLDVCSTMVSWC